MSDFARLTAAQVETLVDRIGVGESGNVPFGAPNRSGATVDIVEGDSVLTREAPDRFVLRTGWREFVPGHGFGLGWEELETMSRDEVVRRLAYYTAPRDRIAAIAASIDWRSIAWR